MAVIYPTLVSVSYVRFGQHGDVFETAMFVLKPGRYCGGDQNSSLNRTLVCATSGFNLLAR